MKWVFVAVLLVAMTACSRHHSVVDGSLGKLNDDKRFATSPRAAQTIADISTQLRFAGASCRKQSKAGARCTALLQAAAYSAVTAYTVAECTAPGVFDARRTMVRYLRTVDRFLDGGAKGAVPSVPKVATC